MEAPCTWTVQYRALHKIIQLQSYPLLNIPVQPPALLWTADDTVERIQNPQKPHEH